MLFHALVLAATSQSFGSCGGLGLNYGTTIGISVDKGQKRLSSIEALAAIVSLKPLGPGLHPFLPAAWVIWDERAWPWIATNGDSDPKLVRELHLNVPSEGMANAFTRLPTRALNLPDGYSLQYCAISP